MAKTEFIQTNHFKPYKILVETQAEHDYLYGLITSEDYMRKENCPGFTKNMDKRFDRAMRYVDGKNK